MKGKRWAVIIVARYLNRESKNPILLSDAIRTYKKVRGVYDRVFIISPYAGYREDFVRAGLRQQDNLISIERESTEFENVFKYITEEGRRLGEDEKYFITVFFSGYCPALSIQMAGTVAKKGEGLADNAVFVRFDWILDRLRRMNFGERFMVLDCTGAHSIGRIDDEKKTGTTVIGPTRLGFTAGRDPDGSRFTKLLMSADASPAVGRQSIGYWGKETLRELARGQIKSVPYFHGDLEILKAITKKEVLNSCPRKHGNGRAMRHVIRKEICRLIKMYMFGLNGADFNCNNWTVNY